MWKYIPEYDTREANEFECYDADSRLGEVVGETGHIACIKEYIDENGHEITIFIQQCYNKGYGDRNFVRHIRKRKIPPYFKIRKCDVTDGIVIGVCRVQIYKPEYLIGYNEDMILSDDEIDIMINIFNSAPYMDESCTTLWQEVIKDFNNHYKINGNKYRIPISTKMPDYNLLKKGR